MREDLALLVRNLAYACTLYMHMYMYSVGREEERERERMAFVTLLRT